MRRSRIKLALLLVTLAVLDAFLWPPIQQCFAIIAVQNAIERNYEIRWGDGRRPALLPASWDKALREWLERRYEHTRGADNLDILYYERLCSPFRGQIESIEIHYPEGMPGDLGAALARFPRLRRFVIQETMSTPREADGSRLCARLRGLPRIEEISLCSPTLTDAALTPLAGHPGLSRVTLLECSCTPACVLTLASLPKLKKLKIQPYEDFSQPQQATFRAALPGVTIEF